MVFAGGRPGIYTIMAFLKEKVRVRIGSIEWPAYLDILTQTNTEYETVPFTKENGFRPQNSEYFDRTKIDEGTFIMPVISNPQNPSGQTRHGTELRDLIEMAEKPGNGLLLDEAYEMFHSPSVSGIEFIKDLDNSNIFLQAPAPRGCSPRYSNWMGNRKQEKYRNYGQLL